MTGTAYIAGPMTGYPEFNFPLFDAVAAYMRASGWDVFNPAEHDREMYDTSGDGFTDGDVAAWAAASGFDFHAAMRWDLARITECDAIVFLEGWEKSTGTKHEKYVADVCGVESLYAFNVSRSESNEWFVSEVDFNSVGFKAVTV